MKRFMKLFSTVFLLIFSAVSVHAAGFDAGASIRAVEHNGQEITGTILNYVNKSEISLLDKSGHYFKVNLKNVKRISGVAGQNVMTGGGTNLRVVKFDMVDGQSVSAGLSENAIVNVDLGVNGKRNIWITDYAKYRYVEVVEQGAAPPGDGYMKVKLINGQIIQVPVKREEIHSILFE